ncbi:hypothetical protein PV783_13645 [Chitinophaga sp. CC14]
MSILDTGKSSASPIDFATSYKSLLPATLPDTIFLIVVESQKFVEFARLCNQEIPNTSTPKLLQYLFPAYFCQQAANYCDQGFLVKEILQCSLNNYLDFQSDHVTVSDVHYFAQWQLALVMEQLQLPWQQVEEALIKAGQYNQVRGEAYKYIVQHHKERGDLGIAYMYSTIAKEQFYGKYSPATMKWFADPSYYNWKTLNYHFSICAKLGNNQEAAETFNELWIYSQRHPEEFSEEQLQNIYKNQKAFQQ